MRHILHGRLSYLVFVFALVLAFPSAVSAADPSDFVVRAAGMGGAYTALSSGPAGLIYNPAGIGLRIFEATVNLSAPTMDDLTTLGMLLQDFDPDDYEDFPSSLEVGGMAGLGLGPIAIAGKVRALASVTENEEIDVIQLIAAPEIAAGLGFYVFKTGLINLRMGVSGHYLQGTDAYYELEDGEIVAESVLTGKGQYFSLGAMADITQFLTLGFSARNLAGSFTFEGEEEEKLDPVYTVGAALKAPLPFIGITLAADADSNKELRYGAEINVAANLLSLRVGQIKPPASDDPTGTITTAGASLNLGPLTAGLAARTLPGQSLSFNGIERVVVEGTIRF